MLHHSSVGTNRLNNSLDGTKHKKPGGTNKLHQSPGRTNMLHYTNHSPLLHYKPKSKSVKGIFVLVLRAWKPFQNILGSVLKAINTPEHTFTHTSYLRGLQNSVRGGSRPLSWAKKFKLGSLPRFSKKQNFKAWLGLNEMGYPSWVWLGLRKTIGLNWAWAWA